MAVLKGEDIRGRVNYLAALRERKRVRRLCVASLTLYREIEFAMPRSSRMERYVKVVESRAGADHRSASKIMRLAREGFALWPTERPVNFRDVVRYIVVTDCLEADTGATADAMDVSIVHEIVSELIPAHL